MEHRPACHQRVKPLSPLTWEPVAQLVEHVTFNHGVSGSNPDGLTTLQVHDTAYISAISAALQNEDMRPFVGGVRSHVRLLFSDPMILLVDLQHSHIAQLARQAQQGQQPAHAASPTTGRSARSAVAALVVSSHDIAGAVTEAPTMVA